MNKAFKFIMGISFIFYIFVLLYMLFLSSRGQIWIDLTLLDYIKQSSNIVPFKTISTYIMAIYNGSMNFDIPIKNLVGNLILFLPMGIYLPYFVKRINTVSIFSIGIIILLFVIEVMQLVTRKGSFDIDDFILNMLGALIGFGLWKMKFVQKLNSSFAVKSL